MSEPQSESHKRENRESDYRLYSLGVVVENKILSSDYIKVVPIEHVTTVSGSMNNDTAIHTEKGHVVSLSNSILAKWHQDSNSNRATSPNVYVNETVQIYKYADTDDYYWTTLKFQPEFRKLEKVKYSFSNLPSGMTAYDDTTSYWIEWSTIDKWIKIHTSNNNGEATTYDVEINTKSGQITVKDGNQNSFLWDSLQRALTFNSDTMTFNMGKIMTFNCPQCVFTGNVVIQKNLNVSQTTTTNTLNSSNGGSVGGTLTASTINANSVTAPSGSVPGPKT